MDFNKLFTLLIEADGVDREAVQPVGAEDEYASAEDVINTDGTGVATPENYDVEPAPMTPTVNHGETAQSIKGYIDKLSSFADDLNGTSGESLNDYVNKLDVDGSAYEGISGLKRKIISAAVDLRSIIEDLNGYRIASQRAVSVTTSATPGV